MKNSGLSFPYRRITVNLAPADLRKEGPAYDLPIAVGILAATQQVWPDKLQDALFVGELSLEGTTRHTKGVLPLAALARREGIKRVFVPADDVAEAALLPDIEVIPVANLADLVGHLTSLSPLEPYTVDSRGSLQRGWRVRGRFRRHHGPGARQARHGGRRRQHAQGTM